MPEYANIDEMVFEGRERLFGGYVLRKAYPWTLLLSTGLICGLFLIPTFGYLLGLRMGWIENAPVMRDEIVLFKGKLPAINSNTREVVEVKYLYRVPEPEIWSTCGYYCWWLDSYRADMLSDIQRPEFYASARLDSPITHSLHFDPNQIPLFLKEIEESGDVPEVILEKPWDSSEFLIDPVEPIPLNLEEVIELMTSEKSIKETIGEFSGVIVARILVDKDGFYRSHTIIKNSTPHILESVEKYLPLLRFTPAIQGGRPIKFWVNVPFKFTLLR